MADQNQLNQLLDRLNQLRARQSEFNKEINDLYAEIEALKLSERSKAPEAPRVGPPPPPPPPPKPEPEPVSNYATSTDAPVFGDPSERRQKGPEPRVKVDHSPPSNIEKFLGENLINKIGILILVIGVAIGAKYAIDRELISPLVRVILGFVAGGVLVGFSFMLKKKYHNFSAVLLSGGMTILYFMTFFAHDFYGFIPVMPAFGMMVGFTVFTVFMAIHYDRQIIAHLGLVGAYTVPFFLSTGSNNYTALFTYMTVLNAGVLAVAVMRYWKALYYSAFALSWLILGGLALGNADEVGPERIVLFSSLFFLIFYGTFIAYKLVKKEVFEVWDVILLLLNAFIFYGVVYATVLYDGTYEAYDGLFTALNAVAHALVGILFYRTRKSDQNLYLLTSGLSLLFITLAVPIQFDGSWVTLTWIGEALLLFYVGTRQEKPFNFYHWLAYPLLGLTGFSLLIDWFNVIDGISAYAEQPFTPVMNIEFLVSCMVIVALVAINYLHYPVAIGKIEVEDNSWRNIANAVWPLSLMGAVLFTFGVEIVAYFEQMLVTARFELDALELDYDAENYRSICSEMLDFIPPLQALVLVLYFMLYCIGMSVLAFTKFKRFAFTQVAYVASMAALFFFLTVGLGALNGLLEVYLDCIGCARADWMIAIRYISLPFVAGILYCNYRLSRLKIMSKSLRVVFDLGMHITLLALLSTEMIQWMKLADYSKSDQLTMSILWGVYAAVMIGLGIGGKKKHLRIGALALFGITLLKLFLYDFSRLNTAGKTVVLVSLGVLLLVVSFLYNKYKDLIWGGEDVDEVEEKESA